MDLMMGKDGAATERDGFEAIEKLKADLRTAEIPIIVLTSFFEESKVRRAKELGAVDFISVTGQSIQKIPEHYVRYLKDPKHYRASHPIFKDK
jgi:CheY-like chemotaxis protein